MWVGITLAVVIEVVPVPLRTSAVAVYMFIISNVGGNVPLLVPVLKSAFQNLGHDSVFSLRGNRALVTSQILFWRWALRVLIVSRWRVFRIAMTVGYCKKQYFLCAIYFVNFTTSVSL